MVVFFVALSHWQPLRSWDLRGQVGGLCGNTNMDPGEQCDPPSWFCTNDCQRIPNAFEGGCAYWGGYTQSPGQCESPAGIAAAPCDYNGNDDVNLPYGEVNVCDAIFPCCTVCGVMRVGERKCANNLTCHSYNGQNICTNPANCGNGACDGYETCSWCPQDCGACSAGSSDSSPSSSMSSLSNSPPLSSSSPSLGSSSSSSFSSSGFSTNSYSMNPSSSSESSYSSVVSIGSSLSSLATRTSISSASSSPSTFAASSSSSLSSFNEMHQAAVASPQTASSSSAVQSSLSSHFSLSSSSSGPLAPSLGSLGTGSASSMQSVMGASSSQSPVFCCTTAHQCVNMQGRNDCDATFDTFQPGPGLDWNAGCPVILCMQSWPTSTASSISSATATMGGDCPVDACSTGGSAFCGVQGKICHGLSEFPCVDCR